MVNSPSTIKQCRDCWISPFPPQSNHHPDAGISIESPCATKSRCRLADEQLIEVKNLVDTSAGDEILQKLLTPSMAARPAIVLTRVHRGRFPTHCCTCMTRTPSMPYTILNKCSNCKIFIQPLSSSPLMLSMY